MRFLPSLYLPEISHIKAPDCQLALSYLKADS
jgi:hypothetical protein